MLVAHSQELSWEDILIAYSTLPGYVANRDCAKGTWFVQSLCKIFMEHAHNTNLRDMLDLVALDLKQNFTSETGAKQSFNYDVRHFYKKLYFNPGLQVGQSLQLHRTKGFYASIYFFFQINRYGMELMDTMLGMEELSDREPGVFIPHICHRHHRHVCVKIFCQV